MFTTETYFRLIGTIVLTAAVAIGPRCAIAEEYEEPTGDKTKTEQPTPQEEPTTPAEEEIIFLPSAILGFGFEYEPFMVDFKWLLNRFGQDSTITGFELYFGFRL